MKLLSTMLLTGLLAGSMSGVSFGQEPVDTSPPPPTPGQDDCETHVDKHTVGAGGATQAEALLKSVILLLKIQSEAIRDFDKGEICEVDVKLIGPSLDQVKEGHWTCFWAMDITFKYKPKKKAGTEPQPEQPQDRR